MSFDAKWVREPFLNKSGLPVILQLLKWVAHRVCVCECEDGCLHSGRVLDCFCLFRVSQDARAAQVYRAGVLESD